MFKFFLAGSDAPKITDKSKIARLFKSHRLRIMLAITGGYGFYYTCRLPLSVVKKPLLDSGIFTANELGMIGSAFFYAYAFGKLVNGFLADHGNMKRVLPMGLLLTALVNLVMGNVLLLALWIVLWGINGWVQGFGAPGSVVTLSQWFSNRERGRYYGIWSTAHSIGEGLTFVGTAALVSLLGWHSGFWGPGILCVIVSVVMYIMMEDRPQTLGLPSIAEFNNDMPNAEEQEQIDKTSTLELQKLVFKRPAIWILGLSSAMMYVTRYAVNSWGILYLQEARGFSLIEAGSILGLNTVAGILGCVAYGFISDKLFDAKRPPVTLIFGLLEVISLFFIFVIPFDNIIILTAAFTLYGFTLSGILAALGGLFATDISPKKVTGAVMGLIGVFSYLGAAIQEQVSGFLIEKNMNIVDGVRNYDFSSVIVFWVGASVISLILATSLWRVKPKA